MSAVSAYLIFNAGAVCGFILAALFARAAE
jgi:hypothetical protein